MGLGREPIAKTTLASANQNRDYRIFEDFAFYMMKEASEKRTTKAIITYCLAVSYCTICNWNITTFSRQENIMSKDIIGRKKEQETQNAQPLPYRTNQESLGNIRCPELDFFLAQMRIYAKIFSIR